ncbi:hypothetical protein [Methylobacterium symbioticum]|uniref:hypothetical protein n=1 Tax=Methylobacterium symbioticum TaxID=2584084 RepID=UPI001625F6DF|nr:hypothetical protein [Methylobacterium symbioticum]
MLPDEVIFGIRIGRERRDFETRGRMKSSSPPVHGNEGILRFSTPPPAAVSARRALF